MKQTVEEAAREHQTHFEICDAEGTISGFINGMHKQSYESFISGAEWQSKQSPWISVNERLPEKDGYYFVTDGDVVEKVYFFERWNKFTSTRDYPHLFYDEGVIKAWLPIPSFDDIL